MDLFTITISPVEIFLRGTLVYIFIFVVLQVVLKRQSSHVTMNDILVFVLIADAAQNAMAGEYHSVGEGLILVSTIIFWSIFIDWLAYRVKFIGRIVQAPPILLVRDGKVLYHNMRREFITLEELMSQIRQQGIDDITRVKKAYLEQDGNLSVIGKE